MAYFSKQLLQSVSAVCLLSTAPMSSNAAMISTTTTTATTSVFSPAPTTYRAPVAYSPTPITAGAPNILGTAAAALGGTPTPPTGSIYISAGQLPTLPGAGAQTANCALACQLKGQSLTVTFCKDGQPFCKVSTILIDLGGKNCKTATDETICKGIFNSKVEGAETCKGVNKSYNDSEPGTPPAYVDCSKWAPAKPK